VNGDGKTYAGMCLVTIPVPRNEKIGVYVQTILAGEIFNHFYLFMGKQILYAAFFLVAAPLVILSCKKEQIKKQKTDMTAESVKTETLESIPFDLNVVLRGEGNRQGHIQFRQDPDPTKIIGLNTKLHHLASNHAYLLQRAVDAINMVDGNCTSTSWLTLGKGLVAQSILTNEQGKGSEALWRDVTAIPSGSTFDIHFRVIDAVSGEVVLTSDCYQYTVR
jgi:hypothetical protein